MNRWKRITLVVFVLIAGTTGFGYWSFNEFNSSFNDLSSNFATTYISTAPRGVSSDTIDSVLSTSTSINIFGTSTEESASLDVATSTVGTLVSSEIATSTLEATSSKALVVKPFSEKEFRFVFPSRKNAVYIGCTYTISWLSSTTIQSIRTALVDAGTLKASGPIASGISRENIIVSDAQNIKWEVGKVWPGRYYVYVSTVNGTSTDISSQIFTIKDIPNGLEITKQKQLCENSGGMF